MTEAQSAPSPGSPTCPTLILKLNESDIAESANLARDQHDKTRRRIELQHVIAVARRSPLKYDPRNVEEFSCAVLKHFGSGFRLPISDEQQQDGSSHHQRRRLADMLRQIVQSSMFDFGDKAIHPTELKDELSRSRWICIFCHHFFKKSSDVRRHLKNVHKFAKDDVAQAFTWDNSTEQEDRHQLFHVFGPYSFEQVECNEWDIKDWRGKQKAAARTSGKRKTETACAAPEDTPGESSSGKRRRLDPASGTSVPYTSEPTMSPFSPTDRGTSSSYYGSYVQVDSAQTDDWLLNLNDDTPTSHDCVSGVGAGLSTSFETLPRADNASIDFDPSSTSLFERFQEVDAAMQGVAMTFNHVAELEPPTSSPSGTLNIYSLSLNYSSTAD